MAAESQENELFDFVVFDDFFRSGIKLQIGRKEWPCCQFNIGSVKENLNPSI